MPADFEDVGEVGARLSQLDNEAQEVNWASADALRLRGRARAHRRAVAGTTVVCLGIATLGVSITGNLPGQEGFLNTTVPIAGVPTEQRTVSGNPSDSQGSGDGDSSDGTASAPGSSPTGDTDPNGPDGDDPNSPDPTGESMSPTDPVTSPSDETAPTSEDSVTPDPTDSSSPTIPPVSVAAVASAGEFPAFSDADGSWTESGSGSGEGDASSAWRCDKPALDDLGAVGTAWRTHDWTPETTQDVEAELAEVVGAGAAAAFETVEEATDGYGELAAAIADCSAGTAGSANAVSVSSGTAAWWEIDTDSVTHVVGLVQRGSAVAYVALDQPAVDATASMDATLRAAADRLVDWDG